MTLAVTFALQIGSVGAHTTRATAHCGTSVLGLSAGSVTTLVHTKVWKNETEVTSAPSSLKVKHFVCTGLEGQAKFTITRVKTTNCNTLPKSKLQLYPNAEVNILWYVSAAKPGKTWCATPSKNKEAWYGGNTGRTRLYTRDPIFSVAVSPRTTTVEQTYGFFAVYAARTRRPVILGPLQRVVVTATGVVGTPTAFAPTAEDRAAIAGLGAGVPRPNYTRPAAGASKVLARMYSRGEIRVGLDPTTATPEVEAFTRRYFTFLARRWRLRLVVVPDASPEALAAGRIDVAVTPTRDEGSVDVTALPFTEQEGTTWDLELLPEQELVNGFRRYLTTSLEAADYAAHYRAAFGAEPSYERFRTFVFPTLPASAP